MVDGVMVHRECKTCNFPGSNAWHQVVVVDIHNPDPETNIDFRGTERDRRKDLSDNICRTEGPKRGKCSFDNESTADADSVPDSGKAGVCFGSEGEAKRDERWEKNKGVLLQPLEILLGV